MTTKEKKVAAPVTTKEYFTFHTAPRRMFVVEKITVKGDTVLDRVSYDPTYLPIALDYIKKYIIKVLNGETK